MLDEIREPTRKIAIKRRLTQVRDMEVENKIVGARKTTFIKKVGVQVFCRVNSPVNNLPSSLNGSLFSDWLPSPPMANFGSQPSSAVS